MAERRAFLVACGIGVVVVAALQLAALVQLIRGGSQAFDPLLPMLAVAALGGAVQAWLFALPLPSVWRKPRWPLYAMLWLACTFVPVAGGLIVCIGWASASWFPASPDDHEPGIVPSPQFVSHLLSRVAPGSGARLQAQLANPRVAAQDRLSALVAIQGMPTRATGTLLRDLLSDPLEDVRLVAYGTLDRTEQDIQARIMTATAALDQESDPAERYALNRQLAELHFELIYQDLVHGPMYRHALEEADRYAQEALRFDPRDAALWVIRGRLALADNLVIRPDYCLQRALACGFPRDRLVPWLAEAAFQRGDYARVRELLSSLGPAAAQSVLKPVVRYWSS
jgi:hypothetical protein